MRKTNKAFTRVELIVSVATVALMGALAFPLLAASRDSERAICFNNLRQLGIGVRRWADGHNEQVPWHTPFSDGGTYLPSKTGNAYEEYAALANEIATPRVLACPADSTVVVAPDWASLTQNPSYGPQAVSYNLGLHSFTHLSRAMVSSDRNLRVGGQTGCSPTGVNNASQVPFNDQNVQWTNNIHGLAGHLLFQDGSVEFTSSERLRAAIAEPAASAGQGSLHLLRAR